MKSSLFLNIIFSFGVLFCFPNFAEAASINFSSPPNGEIWRAFEHHEISWTFSDVRFARLYYIDVETGEKHDVSSFDLYPGADEWPYFKKEKIGENLYKATFDWKGYSTYYPMHKITESVYDYNTKKNFKFRIEGFSDSDDSVDAFDEMSDTLQLWEAPAVNFDFNFTPSDLNNGVSSTNYSTMALGSGGKYKIRWRQYGVDSVDIYVGRYKFPPLELDEYKLVAKNVKMPTIPGEWVRDAYYDWNIPLSFDPDYADRRYGFKAVGYDEDGKVVLEDARSDVFYIYQSQAQSQQYLYPETYSDSLKPTKIEVVETPVVDKIDVNTSVEKVATPANSVVKVIPVTDDGENKRAFSDLTNLDDFKSINLLKDKGIVVGYADGTFRPRNKINRAEFTKIIMEAKYDSGEIVGVNCFKDVGEEWFSKYVCSAKLKGIIGGYANGNFAPHADINLVEAYKILSELFFTNSIDQKSSKNWYDKYIEVANKNGFALNVGYSAKISREDMAIMIAKIIDEK